jgi:hypothetical protein
MGNRRCKPAGKVHPGSSTTELCSSDFPHGNQALELLLLVRLFLWSWAGSRAMEEYCLKPMQEIRPQNSHCLQAWFSWACSRVIKLRFWSLCGKSGSRAHDTRRHGLPVLAEVLHYPPGLHAWNTGPRTPAVLRLGCPVPAPVPVALGSPALASKPQGLSCLQTWIHYTCSSYHGSWKPMPQHK